jgi:small subunit ribosomal protein S6
MATTTRLHDLTILLDPNAPDDRHKEILGTVNQAIERDGKIVGQHDWGMRRMAFEIDHRGDAAYHLIQFEAEKNELLEWLNNSLKLADGVLRHRIIKVKPGTPAPPTPRPEAPRAARAPEDSGGAVAARAAADAPPPPPAEEESEESV